LKDKINEQFIVNKVVEFMLNKENGNWHKEKVKKSDLHQHGVDIKLVGGKRNSEYFYIECKGKSYAKSAKSINREGWLNALGQIITRMNVKRYSISKEDSKITGINHAYKYGLGLYWESAQVALRRIPKEIAEVLCLHIFSVNDDGEVKYFTPSKFGIAYTKEDFLAKTHENNYFKINDKKYIKKG